MISGENHPLALEKTYILALLYAHRAQKKCQFKVTMLLTAKRCPRDGGIMDPWCGLAECRFQSPRRPDLGWAIGDGQEHGDDPDWDAQEAQQLYLDSWNMRSSRHFISGTGTASRRPGSPAYA